MEKKGLGRGKGFETISDQSIFDFEMDAEIRDLLQIIADRALATIKLLIDEGKLDRAGVAEDLGLG